LSNLEHLPGGAEKGGRNLRRFIQGLCSTCSEINDFQIDLGEKMSEQMKSKKNIGYSRMGLFMALGLVLGGLVGLTMDNLVVFSGGGMMVGLAIGIALEKRQQT
jgi:hypothetical protein